jgi:hypothetical protein
MRIKGKNLDDINYKKVIVKGNPYTLFVDGVSGDNAHILFIDKDEQVKGEIQAFVKDTKHYHIPPTITGWFDMFMYKGKDIYPLTPNMIEEA